MRDTFQFFLRVGVFLAFTSTLFAQSTSDKILIVNGKTAGGTVRHIDDRFYVDVESLAEAASGTVNIDPDRIVLTIPVPERSEPPQVDHARSRGLSRGFATAAIADLAVMREWRGAIGTMITYGLAVSDVWAQNYRAQVQADLAEAAVAATTDDDHTALGLLQNESDQLEGWSDGVLADRKALTESRTLNANALQEDPELAKVRACGQFLNSMLVSGVFADDSSCH
jgi:hypothetical protein